MEKRKLVIDWSSTMAKIKEQETSSKTSFKDERLYQPQWKEDGTAQAIIRFLPSPDTTVPYVSVYNHGFKGIGGWFIENCPTTLKKECPVCKANSLLWDSDPDTVRLRKRRLSYYSNILVVKDPMNPSNNGKVFLYRYGDKLHKKIMAKIAPEAGSIVTQNYIHDLDAGNDFRLIIKKVKLDNALVPNYDECSFDDKCTSIGTEEFIIKVENSLYSLKDYVSETAFKPYTELEEKMIRVIGMTNESYSAPVVETKAVKTVKESKETKVKEESIFDGDDQEFFNSLQTEGTSK